MDNNTSNILKRNEITSREVLNVLVLFQISLGVLYTAITILGLAALQREGRSNVSIPSEITLEYNLFEGVVMILNGYFTLISTKIGFIGLLVINMAINLAIVNFNCYELIRIFIDTDSDHSDEIAGLTLMWILEFIYYFLILYYSTRILVTIQARRERLASEGLHLGALKNEDIFGRSNDSLGIARLSLSPRRMRVSRQANRFGFPVKLELKKEKVVKIDYDSESSDDTRSY